MLSSAPLADVNCLSYGVRNELKLMKSDIFSDIHVGCAIRVPGTWSCLVPTERSQSPLSAKLCCESLSLQMAEILRFTCTIFRETGEKKSQITLAFLLAGQSDTRSWYQRKGEPLPVLEHQIWSRYVQKRQSYGRFKLAPPLQFLLPMAF